VERVLPAHAEPAFHLLLDTLEARYRPYRIAGGLAARFYGAMGRPLRDIGVEIASEEVAPIHDLLAAEGGVSIEEPAWRPGSGYQMIRSSVECLGARIDLSGIDGALMHDPIGSGWVVYPVDLERSALVVTLAGRTVRMISRAELLRAKLLLGRDNDRDDISQLI
jgi:hypothetical protein